MDKRYKKLLFRFLKKNGCFHSFVRNLRNSNYLNVRNTLSDPKLGILSDSKVLILYLSSKSGRESDYVSLGYTWSISP